MDSLLASYGSDDDDETERPGSAIIRHKYPDHHPEVASLSTVGELRTLSSPPAGKPGSTGKAARPSFKSFISSLPPPKNTLQVPPGSFPESPRGISSAQLGDQADPSTPGIEPQNSNRLEFLGKEKFVNVSASGVKEAEQREAESEPREAEAPLSAKGAAPSVFSHQIRSLLSSLPPPKSRSSTAAVAAAAALPATGPAALSLSSTENKGGEKVSTGIFRRVGGSSPETSQQAKKQKVVNFTVPLRTSLLQGSGGRTDIDDGDNDDGEGRGDEGKVRAANREPVVGAWKERQAASRKNGLAALLPPPKTSQVLGGGHAAYGSGGEGWGGEVGGTRLMLDEDDDDEQVRLGGTALSLPADWVSPRQGLPIAVQTAKRLSEPQVGQQGGGGSAKPVNAGTRESIMSNEAFRVVDEDPGLQLPSSGKAAWGTVSHDAASATAPPGAPVSTMLGPSLQTEWPGNYPEAQHEQGPWAGDLAVAPGPVVTEGFGLVAQPLAEGAAAGGRDKRREREAAEAAVALGGGAVMEVRQADLTKDRPREDQLRTTGIAFGPGYRPVSAGKDKPSKMSRRKHQIGSLFFDMKQKEMELAERRAKGMLTKSETQAKYGWA